MQIIKKAGYSGNIIEVGGFFWSGSGTGGSSLY